jgi:hypothetical protein
VSTESRAAEAETWGWTQRFLREERPSARRERPEAELGEGLLHLVDGAGAVEEAERAGGVGEGVGGDEGDEGRRLAGARRHLQQRVAARVQGALQLPHVRVLLRVDRRVREVHRQAIQIEPHRGEDDGETPLRGVGVAGAGAAAAATTGSSELGRCSVEFRRAAWS